MRTKADLRQVEPTDADLILAAYRAWGTDCATHLIGDFAFAIWDTVQRRLFAARDAMGIRTLYYRIEPKRLLFATEAKQILALPDVPVQPFEPAICMHLSGPLGRPEWSFYDGIAQLAPAYALVAEASGHRTWRYWDIDETERIRYADDDAYVHHFREIFQEAVRCRLRSVKPVGLSLNGGMDSGSVAAMAGWLRQRHGMDSLAPLHAYCWDFDHLPDYDERDVSRILNDHYQLPVVDVPADKNWPLATYPAHSPDRDDPLIWPLQALHNQVMATAKADGMSAVFSGECDDEMVGSGVLDLHGLLRTGRWRKLGHELQCAQREFDLSMREVIKRLLITPYLWSRLSQRRFERLRQSFGRERRDTRYPDWIRPEFAQRIGLGNIKADCMTSPGIKGTARSFRYHCIFSFAGVRTASLRERCGAYHGLGYADP